MRPENITNFMSGRGTSNCFDNDTSKARGKLIEQTNPWNMFSLELQSLLRCYGVVLVQWV